MISAIILAVLGVVSSVAGATLSSISAKKQIEAQKDANNEQRDTQIAENEKSYERSRPVNQMAELIATGMSDQQARQTIAGSYSPAAYSPAAINNSMDGVDLTSSTSPWSSFLGNLGPMLTPLSDLMTDSLTASDGGALGAVYSEKVSSEILDHLDELKLEDLSLPGFLAFAKRKDAPEWASSLIKSDEWKRCVRNISGQRALSSFFDGSWQYANSYVSFQGNQIQNRIKLLQEKYQGYQNIIADTNSKEIVATWNIKDPYLATFLKSDYELALKNIADNELQRKLLTNEDYQAAFLSSSLSDKKQAALYAEVMATIYSGSKTWLDSNSANPALMGIYEAFNLVGFTKSDAGAYLAMAQAAGIPLSEYANEVVKSLLPAANEVVGAAIKVGETVSDVVTTVSEAVSDPVGLLGNTYQFGYDIGLKLKADFKKIRAAFK